MEKRTRRNYTLEFKIQAIELAEQMGSMNLAAEKLGISPDSIRLWRRNIDRSKGSPIKSVVQAVSEVEEIKRLKKQISDLEKTNYI